ncbi:MAG: Gfo/Idh/MocA family oxidoreductase [Pseudomonadota bacterium]
MKFGIVGTGMIADLMARALQASQNAAPGAVASRDPERAGEFAAAFPGCVGVDGIDGLLALDDIEAVYIATPTAAKEAPALAAIAAGRSVIVEKPFVDAASVQRMVDAADEAGVAFMDATHFVHHPRTATIRAALPERIGAPRSLHTSFYYPNTDTAGIRYDPALEPMGAFGDMAWYSMRAVVEYLQPDGPATTAKLVCETTAGGAAVRATGILGFAGGETSTFDVGYTAGTLLMDFHLHGEAGAISMDDFVLDWTDSAGCTNPDIATAYRYRTGVATPAGTETVDLPPAGGQHLRMLEHFVDIAGGRNTALADRLRRGSVKTQQLLDALWASRGG